MTAQRLNVHGIGASEIASIANLNPYASPWDVWLRKTGQAPDIEPSSPMEWGNRLEPAIRQKYVDDTQATVMVPSESLYHDVVKFARATPDGIAIDDKRAGIGAVWRHLVQCKNVGTWVERAWSEAPPAYVQLQEQWELFVTNLQRADVAVLIGGNDFRIYTVHRDDAIIADLVDIADSFWKLVETRTAPQIDDSDACRDHFVRKLAKAEAVELTTDTHGEALFAEWHVLHAQAKATEKRLKVIRNELMSDLADAQADRITSSIGTAKLVRRSESVETVTNWRLIAELMGERCGYGPEPWAEIVKANTTTAVTQAASVSLYPPKSWSKDQ